MSTTPTRAGAASLLLAVVLALISVRASNPWLLLVGCALFTPVLISHFFQPGLDSVTVCFHSRGRVAVGDSVEHLFHAHNRGRRSSPALRLTHSHRGFEPCDLVVPRLPPGGWAELVVQRTAITRGVSSGHDFRLLTTAPFGLASHRRNISLTVKISVHPAIGPVAELNRIARGDQLGGRPTRSGHDPHDLREWRRGDALRQVHWRATARHQRLIVVVPEAMVRSRFALVVAGWSQDDDWEALLSAAAWTAVDAAIYGQNPVRLSAVGLPDHVGDDPGGVLDWFAALRFVPPAPPQVVRAAVEWAGAEGLVVVASTRPLAQDALAPSDHTVTLLPDGRVLES